MPHFFTNLCYDSLVLMQNGHCLRQEMITEMKILLGPSLLLPDGQDFPKIVELLILMLSVIVFKH